MIERYSPTLDAVAEEYGARLIMAAAKMTLRISGRNSRISLKAVGHWSEIKAEWQTQYEAYIATTGEW